MKRPPYFVYVSDSKLEMLYEQITMAARTNLSMELGLNLKIVQARFASQSVDRARHSKIRMVERYLRDDTGTIDVPANYVKGVLNMAWGPFEGTEAMVYFGGRTHRTHLGLGGTACNCLGGDVSSRKGLTSYSCSPYLVAALVKRKAVFESGHSAFARGHSMGDLNQTALDGVVQANLDFEAPRQRLQFFARIFFRGETPETPHEQVLLGSPIYVALAD